MRTFGVIADAIAASKARKTDQVAQALLPRFNGMNEHCLLAAGCPRADLSDEALRCVIDLQDLVSADPQATCLPELMWTAATKHRDIADPVVSERMHQRFHLLALIYELPSSDQRGALREYVFGNSPGAYSSAGHERDVVAGIETFAAFLHEERERVAELTNGFIASSQLATPEQALHLLMTNIGVSKRSH